MVAGTAGSWGDVLEKEPCGFLGSDSGRRRMGETDGVISGAFTVSITRCWKKGAS